MTLKELYTTIGGDYDQALRVLRMDKLLDKHIRRFSTNNLLDQLLEAGKERSPEKIFEASHALKGICSNLGLCKIADIASVIADEFRPGRERTFSDEVLDEKLEEITVLFNTAKKGIEEYTKG